MTTLAERRTTPVKKFTDAWLKCESCKYGNNFVIEIKKDEKSDQYFYAEKCPRCSAYGEFKPVTKKEASKYLLLDDLP
jgi:phage FluMu protein Com